MLPEEIRSGGQIARRQTTFWEVQTRGGSSFRAHFDRKVEFCFVAQAFEAAELTVRHPLLTEYESPSDDLYIASSAPNHRTILQELREAAAAHFDGWRALERYLNDQFLPEAVLRGGNGLLLSGPRSFVSDAAAICCRSGIKCSVIASKPPTKAPWALILGRNFVLAHAFRFEPIAGSPC